MRSAEAIQWPEGMNPADSITAPFQEVLDSVKALTAEAPSSSRGRRKKGRSRGSQPTLRTAVVLVEDGIVPPLFDLAKAADLLSRGEPGTPASGERIFKGLVAWNDAARNYRAANETSDKDSHFDDWLRSWSSSNVPCVTRDG